MEPFYDLEKLRQSGENVIFESVTSSTIDLALASNNLAPALVLTEHQTAGRGRYGRTWEDEPNKSILVTFSRSLRTQVSDKVDTLSVCHLFCLAIWQAIDLVDVKIRWPNDLFANDKKIGGILLSKGEQKGDYCRFLFSVGINFENAATENSINLMQLNGNIDPTELVLKISARLDEFLADLPRLNNPKVRDYYSELWAKASALLGRTIRVTGTGEELIGKVIESSFGGSLRLETNKDSIIELKDYGHQARIELL